jgi:nucleolar protein 14
LQLQTRKAVPIKTYVPKFQTSYSVDKKYDPDRERAEKSKLKAEYKKEFKSAVREFRQDASLLARAKVEKIKEADAQRKAIKDQVDATLKERDIMLRDERERMRIESQEQIAGAQIGAKAAEASIREEIEGAKIGERIGAKRVSG